MNQAAHRPESKGYLELLVLACVFEVQLEHELCSLAEKMEEALALEVGSSRHPLEGLSSVFAALAQKNHVEVAGLLAQSDSEDWKGFVEAAASLPGDEGELA